VRFALKGITPMLHRRIAALLVAAMAGSAVLCAVNLGVARSQEKAENQLAPDEKAKLQEEVAFQKLAIEAEKRHRKIDKMIASYDLKPHPAPAIPDDPPPHEGAMISLPNVVDPTDLVIVEVLVPHPH
jgi:hypothetical protein